MTTILDDPIALYIQENATFKLHFVLIVLPCKQQNVTYTRFFKLICTERRHITKHTQLINIPNNKDYRRRLPVVFYRIASLLCTCLLHTFSKRWFSYHGGEESGL